MGHVFISYSRADVETMQALRDQLGNTGVAVWTDSELTPGSPIWEIEIETAIKTASVLVVILSPEAYNSKWVRRELSLADEIGLRIVPFLARGEIPSEAIPLSLMSTNWIDARNDHEMAISRLINALGSESQNSVPKKSSLLKKYGRDLGMLAKQGELRSSPRGREVRRLARILIRLNRVSPLLVGKQGVDISKIVEGLAFEIHDKAEFRSLISAQIVQVDIGLLLIPGADQERNTQILTSLINEFLTQKLILFTNLNSPEEVSLTLRVLKVFLFQREIRYIAGMSEDLYQQCVVNEPDLVRYFEVILVGEPNPADAIEILKASLEQLERHHRVVIPLTTLEAAVRLSHQFLPDEPFPERVFDVLDEACARVVIRTANPGAEENSSAVSVLEVFQVVSERTGLSVNELEVILKNFSGE